MISIETISIASSVHDCTRSYSRLLSSIREIHFQKILQYKFKNFKLYHDIYF
jgi:hypothetical protein